MASIKRKSANDRPIQASKKRPKIGTSEKKTSRHLEGGVISVDQLAWKEVTLPDRLEDAEGFFGLEEIEDVEIVRDVASGNIAYKVRRGLRSQSTHM